MKKGYCLYTSETHLVFGNASRALFCSNLGRQHLRRTEYHPNIPRTKIRLEICCHPVRDSLATIGGAKSVLVHVQEDVHSLAFQPVPPRGFPRIPDPSPIATGLWMVVHQAKKDHVLRNNHKFPQSNPPFIYVYIYIYVYVYVYISFRKYAQQTAQLFYP